MIDLVIGTSATVSAVVEPEGAFIASYAWSESSGGTVIALQPGDDGTAQVAAVAVGEAQLAVDTVNADGSAGPSYSETVTVIDPATDPTSPILTSASENNATSVSFEWTAGAEVAPDVTAEAAVSSDAPAPPSWTAPELTPPSAAAPPPEENV